jgi:hypothetical protein
VAALAGAGAVTFHGDGTALASSPSGAALAYLQTLPAQTNAQNSEWAYALIDPRTGAYTGAWRCGRRAGQKIEGSLVVPAAFDPKDYDRGPGLSLKGC